MRPLRYWRQQNIYLLNILHATRNLAFSLSEEYELEWWILGSDSGDYEKYDLLVCNAVQFGDSSMFRVNI
jgi:hypothetical protein